MRLNHPKSTPQPSRQDVHYEYNGQTINYSLWLTPDDMPIRTIVFLGTVQIGKLPLWVAQQCPPGTIVVQGAPHWLAKDGSDITDFMFHFTQNVFEDIIRNYAAGELRVIADSQAVPGVLHWLAKNNHNITIRHLALLQPLGLNADSFKKSHKDPARLLKERVAKNFRYQALSLFSDYRLMYNHRQLFKTVGYGDPTLNTQYNQGLTYDSTEDLKKMSTTNIQIIIICGQRDMMFPPSEIEDTIQKKQLDVPLLVVPYVPHSSLATRYGRRLLKKAFDYFALSV